MAFLSPCRSLTASFAKRSTSGGMLMASHIVSRRTIVTQALSAEVFVADALKANKVVVFSKSYCPYCTKAKNALASVIPGKFTALEVSNTFGR